MLGSKEGGPSRGQSTDLLALLQDAGLHKVNDKKLRKEKFSSALSGCGMSDDVVESR